MDEVKEILLCEVANEFEATLVVNLLKEEEIPAWSDASPATHGLRRAPVRAGPSRLRARVDGDRRQSRSSAITLISRDLRERPRAPIRCLTPLEPCSRPRSSTPPAQPGDPSRPGLAAASAYVVSYFHPFASGAEGQALAQGLELARRGHEVHVVTRDVPGYPVVDEDYHGVFIHRWVKPRPLGPLFGLSFVAGVMGGLAPPARGDRRDPHAPGAVGGRGDGDCPAIGSEASRRSCSRPVRATTARPTSCGAPGRSGLLRRLILANTAFAAISAEIERQWLELGVPAGRMIRMASGVDAARFRPGPVVGRGRASAAPARGLHRPTASPEEHPPAAGGLDGGRPPVAGQPDPGRAGQRSPEARGAGRLAGTRRARPVHRRGRRSRRVPPRGRPLRPAQRGRGYEQLAPGGDGDRPALRRLADRRQHRSDRRPPDRATGGSARRRGVGGRHPRAPRRAGDGRATGRRGAAADRRGIRAAGRRRPLCRSLSPDDRGKLAGRLENCPDVARPSRP